MLDIYIQGKGKKPPRIISSEDLEYESRRAAKEYGYTWTEFQALPGDDWWAAGGDSKCKVLISYRIANKLEEISWQT